MDDSGFLYPQLSKTFTRQVQNWKRPIGESIRHPVWQGAPLIDPWPFTYPGGMQAQPILVTLNTNTENYVYMQFTAPLGVTMYLLKNGTNLYSKASTGQPPGIGASDYFIDWGAVTGDTYEVYFSDPSLVTGHTIGWPDGNSLIGNSPSFVEFPNLEYVLIANRITGHVLDNPQRLWDLSLNPNLKHIELYGLVHGYEGISGAFPIGLTEIYIGIDNALSATSKNWGLPNPWRVEDTNHFLIDLESAGSSNGILKFNVGVSGFPAPDDPVAIAARASLVSRGWTITGV